MRVAYDSIVLHPISSRNQVILRLIIADFYSLHLLGDLKSLGRLFLSLHIHIRNGVKRKERLKDSSTVRLLNIILLLNWILQIDAFHNTVWAKHLPDLFLGNWEREA